MNKIHPLGTEQDPSGLHLGELMQDRQMHAIDCRLNAWSWRRVWQKPYLSCHFGERYHYAGAYLGNAKHPSNQMFLGKREVELVNPEMGVKGLITYLGEGRDLVLIDCYLDYQYSHLNEVIRLLAQAMPDVEVLLPEETPVVTMPQRGYIRPGAKVSLTRGKEHVPAIILRTDFAPSGDYLLCWLRIAQRNALNDGRWLVSEVGPVQSHKLTKRFDFILELDGEAFRG
jgi:hypothetical protein